jgi:hypothetical protein
MVQSEGENESGKESEITNEKREMKKRLASRDATQRFDRVPSIKVRVASRRSKFTRKISN